MLKKITSALLCASLLTPPASAQSIVFRYQPEVMAVNAMEVSNFEIPDLYIGEPHTQTLTVSGGVGSHVWSHEGTLPPGLGFSAGGVLYGTPSSAGTYSDINFMATDEVGDVVGSGPVTSAIYNQLQGDLLNDVWSVDVETSKSVPVSGGKAPFRYSVASGDLPPGMFLNEGTVTGTPTTLGNYASVIQIRDANGRTTTSELNITILSKVVASAEFPDAYVGESYTGKFLAQGGSPDYYAWNINNGSLPDTLSLVPETGEVSGSITSAGTYSFSGSLTDGYTFDYADVTLNAYELPEIASKTFADPYMGSVYDVADGTAPSANGGKLPYTWSATGLPSGMAINPYTGAISGSPTSSGPSVAVIQVSDANERKASETYHFDAREALALADKQYPEPYVGSAYATEDGTAPVASGGKTPYQWSATGLPSGMTIDAASGVVSGSPSNATETTATLRIADANGKGISKNYTFTPRGPLALAVKAYSDPYMGSIYSAEDGTAPIASGGKSPFAWSASGLPAGMTIDASTGIVSGSPSSSNPTTAVISIVDANSKSISGSYPFTPREALVLATKQYPEPYGGTAYSAEDGAAPTATGGKLPYVWSASGLPAGMAINGSTGVISGSPTDANQTTATIRIVDANGKQTSQNYSFAPRVALALAGKAYADPYVGSGYTQGHAPAVSGGLAPYTWTASGLPAGLSINPANGDIYGTPTSSAATTATLVVTDANGKKASNTYSFTPRDALVVYGKQFPDPYVGSAYGEGAPAAGGGKGPYVWSASGLPAGLSINTANGVVSGWPSNTNATWATIAVTDANGVWAGQTFSFAPQAAVGIANNIPDVVYMTTGVWAGMSAWGGKGPYTFSATGLPPGMWIDQSNGIVQGTPGAAGNFWTTVTVTDANGKAASAAKNVVSDTGTVYATLGGGDGPVALRNLFSEADWNSNAPKVVTLPAGHVRGSTWASPVVTIGGNWNGTLTFNVQGEIQGFGGARNSGAGGHAFRADALGWGGQKLTMNVTGAIRGGGGGGGAGGAGGQGGNGVDGYSVREPASGQYGYSNDYRWYIAKDDSGTSRFYTYWGGQQVVINTNTGLTSFVWGEYTYYRGSQSTTNRWGIYRTRNVSTPTYGGGGGAGGMGGVGQGYAQGNGEGTAGQGGGGPTGNNAGWGGTGGWGNWGNSFGNWGLTGIGGNPGGNGNVSGGAGGQPGAGGGAPGIAIDWAGNVNLNNGGTINGAIN